jgi:hypothetical protein
MATQSILRNGIVSPVRAIFKTAGTTRSTLKHVQFLPSPSLVSTFATHSASSYDRAPISTSPQERIYLTSLDGFTLSAPPKPFRSPAVTNFEDPRSPTLQPAAKDSVLRFANFTSNQSVTRPSEPPKPFRSPAVTNFEDPRSPTLQPAAKDAGLRFANFTSDQTVTRPSKPLGKSLYSYPRSPYPSAPLSPTGQAKPKDRENHRSRSRSLELPTRNKKGLTLTPSAVVSVAPTPSSLGRAVFSPSISSINRGKKPAPLDLESRLSQDFWQSLTLEEAEQTDDEPMMTALEYPVSAVEYEGNMDRDMHTSQPQIMYASADGALWSAEMPQPSATLDRIRNSLMSPGKRSSFSKVVRKDFTAPTPNDPFAAFPSFAAAIEMGAVEGFVAYPPRVVLECGI